jgi:hypothetical protein
MKLLSEKKVSKYLKAKDLEGKKQLQHELNTMIKQEFGNKTHTKKVHDVTTALISIGIIHASNRCNDKISL